MSTITQELQPSNVVAMPKALGKTEQRVQRLLSFLEEHAMDAFSYQDLMRATGTPYDALLYVLHALEAVGVVEKQEVPDGPGRPRVTFQWASPRVTGTRRAASTG